MYEGPVGHRPIDKEAAFAWLAFAVAAFTDTWLWSYLSADRVCIMVMPSQSAYTTGQALAAVCVIFAAIAVGRIVMLRTPKVDPRPWATTGYLFTAAALVPAALWVGEVILQMDVCS